MKIIPKPGLYRHYRNGHLYRLLFIARRSEEVDELDCIYIPLYESPDNYMAPAQVISQPVEMWGQIVDLPEGHSSGMEKGRRFSWEGD